MLRAATPERLSAFSDGVFAVLITTAAEASARTGVMPARIIHTQRSPPPRPFAVASPLPIARAREWVPVAP